MNEQTIKNKFSFLNSGLFNFYRRTMQSFVDDANGKNENDKDDKDEKKKNKINIGVISEIKTGTKTNKQIRTRNTQQTQYDYKRVIEPMNKSSEEKKLDISKNKREHKKEEYKKEEHKNLEKNFSNELMQSYYNSTCYIHPNANYLKEPKEMKRGEYLQCDKYMNTYTNNTHNYNYNYNNDYNNNDYINNDYINNNNTCGSDYGNEYKKRNNNPKFYYNYDNLYKNKDLLLYDEALTNTADIYNFNKIKDDKCVYNEIKKLKNDITLLQLMNANLQKQLITNQCSNVTTVPPHNIIINNKTEFASSTVNTIERQHEKKHKGIFYLFLKKLLSNRFNQMLFISSIFVSFFLLNKQWQRAIKIAKLEKRVNSNILLKSVKMLEETMGIRKLNYI